jgi:hypothetical protein
MKNKNLLVNFDYKTYNLIGVLNYENFKLQRKKTVPFLEIKIDFAAGKFALLADWQFILKYNNHTEQQYTYTYNRQVQIQMDIFPTKIIDINNKWHKELMLPLEGTIKDVSVLNGCSGMLVLKNATNNKNSDLSRLVIYLYDHSDNAGEIKFDLPIYLGNESGMN